MLFGWYAWRANARAKARGEARKVDEAPTDPYETWADYKRRHGRGSRVDRDRPGR